MIIFACDKLPKAESTKRNKGPQPLTCKKPSTIPPQAVGAFGLISESETGASRAEWAAAASVCAHRLINGSTPQPSFLHHYSSV